MSLFLPTPPSLHPLRSSDLFRQVCIMAGCDYLCSVDKVGIKTAGKLAGQFKTDVAKVRD